MRDWASCGYTRTMQCNEHAIYLINACFYVCCIKESGAMFYIKRAKIVVFFVASFGCKTNFVGEMKC